MSMRRVCTRLAVAVALVLAVAPTLSLRAQQPNNKNDDFDPLARISKPGPMDGNLGEYATIKVPKGFRFIGDRAGIKTFNDLTQNPTSPMDLGVLVSDDVGPGNEWYIVFVYSDDGFVKDDDRNNLDADAILSSRQEMQGQANGQRKQMGFEELDIVGWSVKPFYDPKSNNLTWGIRIRGKATNSESVNYESRLLGRKGYFSAVLVGEPQDMGKLVPIYDNLLKGFAYRNGQKYSEFREGDKIAQYTLTTLAAGGILAIAAKTGLLGKLLKPLLFVGAAIVFGVGSFFKKIFGSKKNDG